VTTVDDETRHRSAWWIGRTAAGILALGVLAALLLPLWSMDDDLDEQVVLTAELLEGIDRQVELTEQLVGASLPVLESAEPVLAELEADLPALRQLIDESLPLLATLREETLPRVHGAIDESLELQRESLVVARETLEEARETNRRLAALEPATGPAGTLD
jgi:ABC-type transporter Mla subunit MlaD